MAEELTKFEELHKQIGTFGVECLSCGGKINRPKEEFRIYCLKCFKRPGDE